MVTIADIDLAAARLQEALDQTSSIIIASMSTLLRGAQFVKSPIQDDWSFLEQLAEHKVFCLPGQTFGLPGYFRISLTGNDEMIERSIPGFSAAFRSVNR